MLRARADIVIVDTAPILPAPDTMLLQPLVDGTVLVVDTRRGRGKAIVSALAALRHTSGTVLGVVLNKSERRAPLRGYNNLSAPAGDTLLLNPPVTANADGAVSPLRQAGL